MADRMILFSLACMTWLACFAVMTLRTFMTFLPVRALLVVMEVVDDLDFMHG